MASGDAGEDIALDRPLGYHQALGFELVAFLQSHGDAIAYISFSYYFDNSEVLMAAPIQNMEGEYVTPSVKTIGDGSYNPLVRNVSVYVSKDREALRDAVPFLRFGFTHPSLVTATGTVWCQYREKP